VPQKTPLLLDEMFSPQIAVAAPARLTRLLSTNYLSL